MCGQANPKSDSISGRQSPSMERSLAASFSIFSQDNLPVDESSPYFGVTVCNVPKLNKLKLSAILSTLQTVLNALKNHMAAEDGPRIERIASLDSDGIATIMTSISPNIV